MSQPSPWAVLLCRFKDTNQINIPLARVRALFTSAGAGTFNMPRYFAEMSHDTLDLSGSQVFPQSGQYLTVDANVGSYVAPTDPAPPGWMPSITRDQLISKAYATAMQAGIPLQSFYGIAVVFNTAIGITFGGQSSVGPFACSDYRWVTNNGTASHAHEFGHAYGLSHSRRAGSSDDYKDPWDIMSAGATFQAADPDFGSRGPGLNAANMRAVDWLDSNRVWRGSETGFNEVIQLRPLHRRDLPGFLAMEFPPYGDGWLVELRLRSDWDSAIPRSAVFVHSFSAGASYLQSSTSGIPDLIAGDVFAPSALLPLVPRTRVEVISISDADDMATIRVSYSPAQPLPADWHGIPIHILAGIRGDSGGVIWNGRQFIPVPPWNPMARIVMSVSQWMNAAEIGDSRQRNPVLRAILARMQTDLAKLEIDIDPIQVPAPIPPRLPMPAAPKKRKGRAKAKRTTNKDK